MSGPHAGRPGAGRRDRRWPRCWHGGAPGAVVAVLAVVLLAAMGGCQRRTNVALVPPDSTHAATRDSSAVELREAQQMWESGSDLESAAATTARLLSRELKLLAPADWRERAGYMLDSLGVGSEFAEARCAIMVNFFSRSDPEGGSWPYLYWCSNAGLAWQALEGKGLHLQGMIARGLGETRAASGDSLRLVSAVFSRRAQAGLQPLAMTWTLPPRVASTWRLVQTLGADSLGGYGTAGFEAVTDTSAELFARAYRTPKGFAECATCPHAYTVSRFRWASRGFVRLESRPVSSPYAAFAGFIRALVSGDQVAAADFVSEPSLVLEAQRLGWSGTRGAWRPAPGSDETPLVMTFFRGPKEAYSVHFRPQADGWVITGFEPASRTVE